MLVKIWKNGQNAAEVRNWFNLLGKQFSNSPKSLVKDCPLNHPFSHRGGVFNRTTGGGGNQKKEEAQGERHIQYVAHEDTNGICSPSGRTGGTQSRAKPVLLLLIRTFPALLKSS